LLSEMPHAVFFFLVIPIKYPLGITRKKKPLIFIFKNLSIFTPCNKQTPLAMRIYQNLAHLGSTLHGPLL